MTSEPFFAGAYYFRPDFAVVRPKQFAAGYFWSKVKLKQKKFICKKYSVAFTWEIKKSANFIFYPEIIGRFLGAGPLLTFSVSSAT